MDVLKKELRKIYTPHSTQTAIEYVPDLEFVKVDLRDEFTNFRHTFDDLYGVSIIDDGRDGYLYITNAGFNKIYDSLLLYNRGLHNGFGANDQVSLVYRRDIQKFGLCQRGHVHAAVDLSNQKACCRTGMPNPDVSWCHSPHAWNEDIAVGLACVYKWPAEETP